MHWVTRYLNKKWEPCGRGPDTFDCWGLIYDFYKRFLGVPLPLYQVLPSDLRNVSETFSESSGSDMWQRVSNPEAFDVVGLGRKSIIHHVGLYLENDGGMILHVGDGIPAKAETLNEIRKQYKRIEFYRHARNS